MSEEKSKTIEATSGAAGRAAAAGQPSAAVPTLLPERALTELEAFAWTYAQRTGELLQDGKHVSTGYSGAGVGKNNPDMENAAEVGPIPRGEWRISGPPVNSRDHGPYVLRLKPEPNTETFGRSGFLMHGDSKEHPGSASHGCVILPRAVRESVWKSGDRELRVVAEGPDPKPEEAGDE